MPSDFHPPPFLKKTTNTKSSSAADAGKGDNFNSFKLFQTTASDLGYVRGVPFRVLQKSLQKVSQYVQQDQ